MNIASILATKGGRVITIRPEQSVGEAVQLLASHNIGALVVVDQALTPVGILSERDIVRAAARSEQAFGQRVSEIMTRNLITGLPHDDLLSVANTMTDRRIRHLPVVEENGSLFGLVSIRNLLHQHVEELTDSLNSLEAYFKADGPGG